MSRKVTEIKVWLGRILFACIVPMLVLGVALAYWTYRTELVREKERTVTTARALAATLQDRIEAGTRALATLSASGALERRDLDAFRLEAEAVRRTEGAQNLLVVSDDGMQVLNLRVGATVKLPAASPAHARTARLAQKPEVHDLFKGVVTGTMLVSIGYPVTSGGRRYALMLVLDLNDLRHILLRQRMPPAWTAAILDGNGAIMAHTRDHEKRIGTSAPSALAQRTRAAEEDVMNLTSTNGTEQFVGFSRITGTLWSVVIGVPIAELQAEMKRQLLISSVLVIVVSALAALMAWRLGSRLSRDIEALGEQAPLLLSGQGDAAAVASFHYPELNELSAKLHVAGRRLHEAHERQEATDARLRGIVQTSMDAIVSVDGNQRIVVFNLAAQTLFGYTPDEVLGQPLSLLLPQAARTGHERDVQAFIATPRPGRPMALGRTVRALRKDGVEVPVEASLSVWEGGFDQMWTATLRDVSERERTREDLLRSNLDLQQFAFVASHDLRSPLRSVSGFLDMLEKRHGQTLGEGGRALLKRAVDAVDRLDQTTEALLTYARLDSETRVMGSVDLGETAQAVVEALDASIKEAGAMVEIGELPQVWGYPNKLSQLLQNLIGNSLKYRLPDKAPHVRVSARRGDGEWWVTVEDNGIGMEKIHLERIFEIFKRLHTRDEYPGSGIGLAICRRIVTQHGGRIWAESEPGQGSRFTFTIADQTRGA